MLFAETVAIMSAVIDILIVLLTPFLIAAYLAAALLILHRKILRKQNGLYATMVWSLLIIAASWILVEITYFRNLFGLFSSIEQIFSVRVFRLLVVIASLYNIYQYYVEMNRND